MLPGGPQLWKLTGHAACLGLLGAAGYSVYGRAMRKIEAGATADDAGHRVRRGGPLDRADGERRPGQPGPVGDARPGGTAARPDLRPAGAARSTGRPGMPDLSIETVMGEPAKATPVQVYVSLDSAPTPRERVDLALAEMERTGAFDRSLIMLVSPTGTGLRQLRRRGRRGAYLTRGDVATVTHAVLQAAVAAVAGQGQGRPRAEPASCG